MRLKWWNAGIFAGTLYVCLNIVSVVTIFGFNQYEGKLGGRWDNFLLDATVHLALTMVSGIGYLSALLVASSRQTLLSPGRAEWAGAIAAALAFAPLLASDLLREASTSLRIAAAGAYWFCLGALVAVVNWWPRQRRAKAA